MLRRKFYATLLEWKKRPRKRPLLVKGARQVGKTFIIDRFGRDCYDSYVYLNFLKNEEHQRIFSGSLDAQTIFSRLSLVVPSARIVPGKTLIFLDEIQECGNARSALKFLSESTQVDVVASGSLLGVQYKEVRSVPVGYEEPVTMGPLDFEEFLWAKGYPEGIVGDLRKNFEQRTKVDEFVNEKLLAEVRDYMVVGGMPAVVDAYVHELNYSRVDDLQRGIVDDYLDDILHYAALSEKPKVKNCFLSIPRQLARESENRKFKFAEVQKGVGARKFGNSVEWLRDSSMALMAENLTVPRLPLSGYVDEGTYKLYAADIGLLMSMYGLETKAALLDNRLQGPVKGAIYENLVATMLASRGYALHYYRDRHRPLEVEFLVERDGAVVPVEVKASNRSTASLDRILARDEIGLGYKLVNGNVGVAGKKVTLPHYMALFV